MHDGCQLLNQKKKKNFVAGHLSKRVDPTLVTGTRLGTASGLWPDDRRLVPVTHFLIATRFLDFKPKQNCKKKKSKVINDFSQIVFDELFPFIKFPQMRSEKIFLLEYFLRSYKDLLNTIISLYFGRQKLFELITVRFHIA